MLGEFILLNEKDINKQDDILKYFYLIDSDQIIADLNSSFSNKKIDSSNDSLIDNLFHTTFEKIYEYSLLYNEYINPDNFTYSAFFGEPGLTSGSSGSNPELEEKCRSYRKTLECFQIFLKLFLRNHCITQGFFYYLSQRDSSFVPISSKYDLFLKSGYFDKPNYKEADYNNDENKSPQFYNSKFNSFKDLGKNSFLERLLIDCHCEINMFSSSPSGKKIRTTNILVPPIYKHWVYSIFHTDYIKNISRVLTNVKKDKESNIEPNKKLNVLLDNYKKLFNSLREEEEKFPKYCDRFIFHTLNEYYFGFSTINYTNILLNTIHHSYSSSEYDYLKRYEGSILRNILKQFSYCPMSYTRHLFLSYAFEALRYNEDVECKYLHHPLNTITFVPTKIKYTEQTLSAKGLILITEFFNTINNITLPVLSSLWVIVLNKLIKDSGLLMKYHKSYIESHYKLLTADFSSLLKDEMNGMKKCCSEKGIEKTKNNISTQFSLEKLMEQLEVLQKPYTQENNFLVPSDKHLPDIIYAFLEPDRNSQLQLLSNVYGQVSSGDAYELQRKNFQHDRAKDIFKLFHECT